MTLEELQAMSDKELDALSAPIMGCVYQNGKLWKKIEETEKHRLIRDWNPTGDMNDAMELVTAVGDDYNFELNRKPSGVEHLLYEAKFTDGDDTYLVIGASASRCITIASILVKEE